MIGLRKAVAYTDGACSGNPGPGGWAYVLFFEEDGKLKQVEQTGQKEETTNNEMELSASYMALVKAYRLGIRKVTIYSDSAYIVNAIRKNWLANWINNGWKTKDGNDVKNKHIWNKLYKLVMTEGIEVNAVKIKGHEGDLFNEYVDKKAVEARQTIE